ncbi:hypothetical protein [Aquipuribacter nitratireducens]|uniref:Uncharacterized protein n=1 Tax=Aquipuribacter nitratireducens TaxID=650104 RepID=A0ABW0GR99_9MICO
MDDRRTALPRGTALVLLGAAVVLLVWGLTAGRGVGPGAAGHGADGVEVVGACRLVPVGEAGLAAAVVLRNTTDRDVTAAVAVEVVRPGDEVAVADPEESWVLAAARTQRLLQRLDVGQGDGATGCRVLRADLRE